MWAAPETLVQVPVFFLALSHLQPFEVDTESPRVCFISMEGEVRPRWVGVVTAMRHAVHAWTPAKQSSRAPCPLRENNQFRNGDANLSGDFSDKFSTDKYVSRSLVQHTTKPT